MENSFTLLLERQSTHVQSCTHACRFIKATIPRLDPQQGVVLHGWRCTEYSRAERLRSSSRESKCTVPVAFTCAQKSPVTRWSMCTSVDIVWKLRVERFGSKTARGAALNFPA